MKKKKTWTVKTKLNYTTPHYHKESKPMNCPCGTKQAYDHCCGLYIEKKQIPSTALCLMRSRFSAYALNNIDYIASTMRGAPRQGFSKKKLLLENADIQWHSLAIIDATDEMGNAVALCIAEKSSL